MTSDANIWLLGALALLACYGLGALTGELAGWVRTRMAAGRPEPRRWELTVTDPDGIPMKPIRLTAAGVGHILKDVDCGRLT